jgi:hypothetical protein
MSAGCRIYDRSDGFWYNCASQARVGKLLAAIFVDFNWDSSCIGSLEWVKSLELGLKIRRVISKSKQKQNFSTDYRSTLRVKKSQNPDCGMQCHAWKLILESEKTIESGFRKSSWWWFYSSSTSDSDVWPLCPAWPGCLNIAPDSLIQIRIAIIFGDINCKKKGVSTTNVRRAKNRRSKKDTPYCTEPIKRRPCTRVVIDILQWSHP